MLWLLQTLAFAKTTRIKSLNAEQNGLGCVKFRFVSSPQIRHRVANDAHEKPPVISNGGFFTAQTG